MPAGHTHGRFQLIGRAGGHVPVRRSPNLERGEGGEADVLAQAVAAERVAEGATGGIGKDVGHLERMR